MRGTPMFHSIYILKIYFFEFIFTNAWFLSYLSYSLEVVSTNWHALFNFSAIVVIFTQKGNTEQLYLHLLYEVVFLNYSVGLYAGWSIWHWIMKLAWILLV